MSDTPKDNKNSKSSKDNDKTKSDTDEKYEKGIDIKGKLFGVEDVKEATGDEVCRVALVKLKAVILAKKEHKPQITVNLSTSGIKITDDKTREILYSHAINSISYISIDPEDLRAIGIIVLVDGQYQYIGIRTKDAAEGMFNILKRIFEIVLIKGKAKKEEQEEEQVIEKKEPTTDEKRSKVEEEVRIKVEDANAERKKKEAEAQANNKPIELPKPPSQKVSKPETTKPPIVDLMSDDINGNGTKSSDDLLDFFLTPSAQQQPPPTQTTPFFSPDPNDNLPNRDPYHAIISSAPVSPPVSPPVANNPIGFQPQQAQFGLNFNNYPYVPPQQQQQQQQQQQNITQLMNGVSLQAAPTTTPNTLSSPLDQFKVFAQESPDRPNQFKIEKPPQAKTLNSLQNKN